MNSEKQEVLFSSFFFLFAGPGTWGRGFWSQVTSPKTKLAKNWNRWKWWCPKIEEKQRLSYKILFFLPSQVRGKFAFWWRRKSGQASPTSSLYLWKCGNHWCWTYFRAFQNVKEKFLRREFFGSGRWKKETFQFLCMCRKCFMIWVTGERFDCNQADGIDGKEKDGSFTTSVS